MEDTGQTITLSKDKFEEIEKLLLRIVEFEKLSEIPAFAVSQMGDLNAKEITSHLNYRTMMLVRAMLQKEDPPPGAVVDCAVQIGIMLIFLAGQLGIDLVAAINSKMSIEKEMVEIARKAIQEERAPEAAGKEGVVIPISS